MTEAIDPLSPSRRRLFTVLGVGTLTVALAGIWAWWPALPSAPSADPATLPEALAVTAPTRAPTDSGPVPLNLAAFGAPIWDPSLTPPKVNTAAAQSAPPPPLRLVLLGIARDDAKAGESIAGLPARYVAAIYDEVGDRVYMVRSGDTVGAGPAKVTAITADTVEVSETAGGGGGGGGGGGVRTLALHQPVSSAPILLVKPVAGAGPEKEGTK